MGWVGGGGSRGRKSIEVNRKSCQEGGEGVKASKGEEEGFFDKWLFIGTGQSREGTGDISNLQTLSRITEEITCFKFDKKKWKLSPQKVSW